MAPFWYLLEELLLREQIWGKFWQTSLCPTCILCLPWTPTISCPSFCSPLSFLHFNKNKPLGNIRAFAHAIPLPLTFPATSFSTYKICLKTIPILEDSAQKLTPLEAKFLVPLPYVLTCSLTPATEPTACYVIMVLPDQELWKGKSLYKPLLISALLHQVFSALALLIFRAG